MVTRIGLFLPAFLLLAAAPAAAQEADPTGMWEGRWRTEARHHVEGPATPKQLRHEGFLEARFVFCVGKDGAIGGTGTAKVGRKDAPKVARTFDFGASSCQESFEPTEAEVPVKVTGQRQADEFSLRLETGTVDIQQKGVCTVPGAPTQSWSNAFPAPATWFVLFAGSSTNPVVSGLKIAAEDGAEQEVRGSDAYADSDAPTRGIVEHRNRLQIRRPKNAAEEVPIVLGQVFASVGYSWDPTELYPSGERKLESILPELKAALDGSSGKLRCPRPKVTAVIGKGPDNDELFLEALNRARRDALKNWFVQRGIDTSQVDWETAFGPEDDVQVSFVQ